jgi:hypothetical protein
MPLPLEFVSRIHTRLLARYGSRWLQLYPGFTPKQMQSVSEDWADVLGGLLSQQLAHGLAHLPPEFPPNATVFRDICLGAPVRARQLQIDGPPSPNADPERLKAALAVIKQKQEEQKPLDWAYALQEREKQGANLTDWQRKAWRHALATGPTEADVMTTFNPIDPKCLPPGMRPHQYSPPTQNPFNEGDHQ